MSFAVFGINRVKAKDNAVKSINSWEKKKVFLVKERIEKTDDALSKYLNHFINCNDPGVELYEAALEEAFKEELQIIKPSKISTLYDGIAPAKLYLKLAKEGSGDESLHIKQKVKVFDGDKKPVFTKNGKSQKTEWRRIN